MRGQTVGLLNVVTDRAFDEPRTNFAVARVKRDIGGSGYVGVMATDRRSTGAWSSAGGLDWSLWPTGTLNVQGFVARTATSAGDGNDAAYRLAMDYQTDRLGFSAQHLLIGPDATLAQYNSFDRALTANVRINFIHRPGSDLFLVINEERGSDASAWDFANRGAVVKVTYLARI